MKWWKNIKENLISFKLKFDKKGKLLLALILSIVVLVIFGMALKGTKSQQKEVTKEDNGSSVGMQDFISSTENRLENILGAIKGVGGVNVFIMTNQSTEFIYVTDDSVDKSQADNRLDEVLSSSIVFSKNGSESKPILKLEIYPEIVGVLVVAEGANDEKKRLMILNAVATALDIENTKIEVLPAEKVK